MSVACGLFQITDIKLEVAESTETRQISGDQEGWATNAVEKINGKKSKNFFINIFTKLVKMREFICVFNKRHCF